MNIIEQFKGFALLGAEWVMWVLVALSILSVTIMIERVIFFFGQRPELTDIIEKIKKYIASGDFESATEFLKARKGVSTSIALYAIREVDNGAEAVEEAAASARIQEKLKLERNLAFLGTVGNNAPFIGLLGTVIGIILAFNDLSLNSTGGASTVMAGISEALVATAIGLLVAIPAVIAFNTFGRRIRTLLGDADALVHTILSGLQKETQKDN